MGLIDGTNIDVTIFIICCAFRGHKGVTQNVFASSLRDKCFTYVLAGCEGSANDFTVLKDAFSLLAPYGLRVYDGLC